MNLWQLFILFVVYSFIGWVGEVIYCSIPAKHFINRGFLFGPVCPVYGCGGLLVVFLLSPFRQTWLELFWAAVFVTTLLEYAVSWLMEKLFHNRWWDYSHYRFQINGRVCLLNSLIFGAMATLAVHFVHPPIMALILALPKPAEISISAALMALFAVDLATTLRTLKSFNQKLAQFHAFTDSLKARFAEEEWFVSKNAGTMLRSVLERAETDGEKFGAAFIEKLESFSLKHRAYIRLVDAFPHLKSASHNEQLEHLKLELKVNIAAKRAEAAARRAVAVGAKGEISTGAGAQSPGRDEIRAAILAQQAAKKEREQAKLQAAFAQGFDFYKLFWIFFICGILGAVLEALFCLLRYGEFQNRMALVAGIFNPLYGLGGVLMTLAVHRLRHKRDLLLFAVCTAIGGAFEFCASCALSLVFGLSFWDYSQTSFTLFGGRTNLVFCIFWGFLGLLWVKDLYPEMSRSIERMPAKLGKAATWILAAILALNMLVSACAVGRYSERLGGVPASSKIEQLLDQHFDDARMEELYPTMAASGN